MFRLSVMEKIAEIGKMYNLVGRNRIDRATKFEFERKITDYYGKLPDGRWCFINSSINEVLYFDKEVSQEAIYTVTKLAEVYSYLYSKEHGNKVANITIFDYK